MIQNSNAGTNDFLSALRRLSPTASANSAAETAASNTLTRSGYARFDNENQSTALHWSFCIIFVPFTRRRCVPHVQLLYKKHCVAHAE
jgi:hypothetical protein